MTRFLMILSVGAEITNKFYGLVLFFFSIEVFSNFFQADLLRLSAIVKLLDRFVVLVLGQQHGVFF